MDFDDLCILIIERGCDDIRAMARIYRKINLIYNSKAKSITLLDRTYYFDDYRDVDNLKRKLFDQIDYELESIQYCVELSKYVCDDCFPIWERFINEIKNNHLLFYQCFADKFDKILEVARYETVE